MSIWKLRFFLFHNAWKFLFGRGIVFFKRYWRFIFVNYRWIKLCTIHFGIFLLLNLRLLWNRLKLSINFFIFYNWWLRLKILNDWRRNFVKLIQTFSSFLFFSETSFSTDFFSRCSSCTRLTSHFDLLSLCRQIIINFFRNELRYNTKGFQVFHVYNDFVS